MIGREYIGSQFLPGEVVDGIRHEDINNLSFSSNSIDLILSNDVFEHVPSFSNSLKECYWVLKPNGLIIATFPFNSTHDKSNLRAKIINGKINHLLEPIYHGNPVSGEGCLVYCDFGWDNFQLFKSCGFDAFFTLDFPAFGRSSWA